MNLTEIRAFDYAPSVSDMLIDHWRRFDIDRIRDELETEADQRENMNAVRIMNSYDAYLRNPKLYMQRFEQVLNVCDSLGLGVICCLFNGWHDQAKDCGGIYLESLIPGFGWAYKENFWVAYLTDMMQEYANDRRILMWETCNKPFGCYRDSVQDDIGEYLYEMRWLREMYCFIKKAEAVSPVLISIREWYPEKLLSDVEHCCDVKAISPYYRNADKTEKAIVYAKEHLLDNILCIQK